MREVWGVEAIVVYAAFDVHCCPPALTSGPVVAVGSVFGDFDISVGFEMGFLNE